MPNNPPVDVQKLGQSIWYDNISRDLLNNGEIKRLIEEDGVVGITSNPTIFMKAISTGQTYDEAITTMLDLQPYEVYERLAVVDIQAAADLLLPVYQRTNKVDGYVSLEVSPLIASDTETTIREAKRLFETVGRPNVMIKIPATEAGLPAIEESIADGINVNITLIFSVKNYQDVAERYIRGLERRLKAGENVDSIASVASFFVSRIDTAVDQQLENSMRSAQGRDLARVHQNNELLGKIAIANAKAAYLAYKRIFHGERFKAAKEAGAMVQRPLWASTGTKNPRYSDTLYLDNLIGAETVNTVPPETLKAFKDHGKVEPTLEQDLKDAITLLDKLAEVGVELDIVTNMLQVDGVEAFADSFQKLMAAIEGKCAVLRAGVMKRHETIIAGYEIGFRRTLEKLSAANANHAIWKKDAAFWKKDPAHQQNIRNRLGWLYCLTDGSIDRSRLKALQEESRRWSHAVVLGMGGSSLAPDVFRRTFGKQAGYPELLVLDSTDPARIKTVEDSVNLSSTLFIVASKSGTTLETECFQRYFFARVSEIQGKDKAGQQFIAITDEGSELAKNAAEDGYRHVFINPSDIGGRYSALSYFGLVPAAVMGLDLDRLFASAEQMLQASGEIIPVTGHPGMWLGALMGYMAKRGHDKLVLHTSEQISSFGDWVEQLVAESTGKEGVGILPLAGGTVGNPHDYDDDRFITYTRLDNETEILDEKIRRFWEAGHPVYVINLHDPYDLGGEFLRWEFATAVAGHLLGVNPFDEPNVTESKKNTNTILGYYQQYKKLPSQNVILQEENLTLYADAETGEVLQKICAQRKYNSSQLAGLLAAGISFARSGDYIAIMAYLEPNEENDAILQDIRRRVRHSTTRAVTIGYGPRFLHSTGQLHKGGRENGIFLQITVDDAVDLDIPGKPYSFGVLKNAQAMGDQEALMRRKLPFVRLHINGDIPKGLSKILEAVKAAEEKQI